MYQLIYHKTHRSTTCTRPSTVVDYPRQNEQILTSEIMENVSRNHRNAWHKITSRQFFLNKRPWGAPTDGRCYGKSRYPVKLHPEIKIKITFLTFIIPAKIILPFNFLAPRSYGSGAFLIPSCPSTVVVVRPRQLFHCNGYFSKTLQ